MKKMILTAAILIFFAGIGYAGIDKACYERCAAQSTFKTAEGLAYCETQCSGKDEEYPQLQLNILKQQLEIQKQTLEIQKQQLELQRQTNEILSSQQKKQTGPEPVFSGQ